MINSPGAALHPVMVTGNKIAFRAFTIQHIDLQIQYFFLFSIGGRLNIRESHRINVIAEVYNGVITVFQ